MDSGKNIDLRTIWILEVCCPDLMHSEIRIFSNVRSKLIQCLVELQCGSGSGKKFVPNKKTKDKIRALEIFQAEILSRNSIDVAGCLRIRFENGKFVHKGNFFIYITPLSLIYLNLDLPFRYRAVDIKILFW